MVIPTATGVTYSPFFPITRVWKYLTKNRKSRRDSDYKRFISSEMSGDDALIDVEGDGDGHNNVYFLTF